jgi:hypothetical protein
MEALSRGLVPDRSQSDPEALAAQSGMAVGMGSSPTVALQQSR